MNFNDNNQKKPSRPNSNFLMSPSGGSAMRNGFEDNSEFYESLNYSKLGHNNNNKN